MIKHNAELDDAGSACDPQRIADLFEGQLSDADEVILEQHLSDCADCRQRLHDAGSDSFVDKAHRFLSNDDRSPAIANDLSVSNSSDSLIQQILSQLAPSDDPEMLGRIGPYEVRGVIGAGGMGVVLKAIDQSLDRIVAIKVLAPHLANSGSARKRFAREAKAAAAVLHPNVIAIHSVSDESEQPYLVMPYVRGPSLQKRIDRDGPLATKEILRVGAQVAAGLAAAHAQGLVHRDVKPANVLLEDGVERVSLTDFGLARAVDDVSVTRSGIIAGTPQYMSPEQARAEKVDQRSDLFSLGSVLYATCTGHPPFRAESSYSVMRLIADREPRPIQETNPDIPDWLCGIIERLMKKDAADRYESAADVADLMKDCLAHVQQPTEVSLPESAAELVKSLGSHDNDALPKSQVGFRFPPIGKFIALAGFGFSLIFAAVLIVLELNKGTLTIESEVDDVSVRILQGEIVAEELKVSHGIESTRISAGNYVVEVDGRFSGLSVSDGGIVRLEQGGSAIVRITEEKMPDLPRTPAELRSDLMYFSFQRKLLLARVGPEDSRVKKLDRTITAIEESLEAEEGGVISLPTTDDQDVSDTLSVGMKSYAIGSYVSDVMFRGVKRMGMAGLHSQEVNVAVETAANDLIEVIESTCGPCRSIHFIPSAMELVVQHTEEGHERIGEFLETMRINESGRIDVKLISASSEFLKNDHEADFEEWLERSSKLTADEVRKLESWLAEAPENSIVNATLVPGKPTTINVMNIPVTLTARHVQDANKIQMRLDINDSDPLTTSVGTIELDGSGLILKQFGSPDFFWLLRPSILNPTPNAQLLTHANQHDAANLIGSWRVMTVVEEDDPEPLESNIILTFDEWSLNWRDEGEPPLKGIYRILPDEIVRWHWVSDSKVNALTQPCEMKYRFQDSNHLQMHGIALEGKASSHVIELKRLSGTEPDSTYVSKLVPVDTSDIHGWNTRDFVDTHARLIRSEILLGSIQWPSDIELIPAGKDNSFQWLMSRLDTSVTEQDAIEIGMRGHVRTMSQRRKILEIIDQAYRNLVASAKTDAAMETIQLLREAHDEACKDRKAAELDHQRLLQHDPPDGNKIAASKAKLKRLNDLLTILCNKLMEFGIPEIAGSLEMSLERARVGAKQKSNQIVSPPNTHHLEWDDEEMLDTLSNSMVIEANRTETKIASDSTLIGNLGTKLLISDVVRVFNREQQQDVIGKTQPPLTDDELIAALRSHFPKLRQTVDAGYMPTAKSLSFKSSNEFRLSDGRTGRCWIVELSLALDDSTAQFPIRKRYIDVEPEKTERPLHPPPKGNTPIADWMTKLNELDDAIYSPTSDAPVTEDEVIAAVTHIADGLDPTEFAGQRAALQEIIATRSLPSNAELTLFRPKRLVGYRSRWENRKGFADERQWTLHFKYPYQQEGKEIFAGEILGERIIDSRPLDYVTEDEIHWGPAAKDGLQLGVAIEKEGIEDVKAAPATSVKRFKPHFYLRNRLATDKITFAGLPHFVQYYDLIATTPTGEALPTKQRQGSYSVSTLRLVPEQLAVGSRLYRQGSSLLVGVYDIEHFEETLSLEPPEPEHFMSHPTHAVNAPAGTPIRIRVSLSHPADRDAEPLLSGEIRLPGLKLPEVKSSEAVRDNIRVLGPDKNTRELVRNRFVELRDEVAQQWGGPLREKIKSADHPEITVNLKIQSTDGLGSIIGASSILHHGTLAKLLDNHLPTLINRMVLNQRVPDVLPEWLDNGVRTGMSVSDSKANWAILQQAYNAKHLQPLEELLRYSVSNIGPNTPRGKRKREADEIFVAQSMAFCQFVAGGWGNEALIEFVNSQHKSDQTAVETLGLESLADLEREFHQWLRDKLIDMRPLSSKRDEVNQKAQVQLKLPKSCSIRTDKNPPGIQASTKTKDGVIIDLDTDHESQFQLLHRDRSIADARIQIPETSDLRQIEKFLWNLEINDDDLERLRSDKTVTKIVYVEGSFLESSSVIRTIVSSQLKPSLSPHEEARRQGNPILSMKLVPVIPTARNSPINSDVGEMKDKGSNPMNQDGNENDLGNAFDRIGPTDRHVCELIYRLRNYFYVARDEHWPQIVSELIAAGDAAVPWLIRELDGTDEVAHMRALGIILCQINDPRSVPALIRAVGRPRRWRDQTYDGESSENSEKIKAVLASDDFWQSPVRCPTGCGPTPPEPIQAALERITGHLPPDHATDRTRIGWAWKPGEYAFETVEVDQAKMSEYQKRQRHWQSWWNQRGSEFLSPAELRKWNTASQPAQTEVPGMDVVNRVGAEAGLAFFPTGPNAKLGPIQTIQWTPYIDRPYAVDFDRGRTFMLNEGKAPGDSLLDWADRMRIDFCFDGISLCAHTWLVDNERWNSLDHDIANPSPIELTVEDGCTDRDGYRDTKSKVPVTYFFVTQEGKSGILRIDPPTDEHGARTWRYRLWDKGVVLDDVPHPKQTIPTEYAGLKWGEPISVTLQTSAPGAKCMYRLGDAEPMRLPENAISDDWKDIHSNHENLYFYYKGGYYGVGNDRWKHNAARKLFYDSDMVAANFFVSELNAARTKYVYTNRKAPELIFNNIDHDGDAGDGPVAEFSSEQFDTISPAEALAHRDRVIGPDKTRFSINASQPCVVLAKFNRKLAMVHVQELDAETNTVTLRYKLAQPLDAEAVTTHKAIVAEQDD